MKKTTEFMKHKRRKVIRTKALQVQDAISNAYAWLCNGGINYVMLIITFTISLFVIKD